MEKKEERKVLKIDAIERGLHFQEDAKTPMQFDPEGYKKRLMGVMAHDRGVIASALTLKKRIL